MSDIEVNKGLQERDLFELFRLQLKKDFEGSGLEAGFTDGLPSEYGQLRDIILRQIERLLAAGSSYLPGLLYRIDISEGQLSAHGNRNPGMNLAEVIAELIIKRTLQKVILKKRFSE